MLDNSMTKIIFVDANKYSRPDPGSELPTEVSISVCRIRTYQNQKGDTKN